MFTHRNNKKPLNARRSLIFQLLIMLSLIIAIFHSIANKDYVGVFICVLLLFAMSFFSCLSLAIIINEHPDMTDLGIENKEKGQRTHKKKHKG